MFKIIVVGIIVTIGGIFLMSKIDPANKTSITTSLVTSLDENHKRVIITGQVAHPGEYIVSPTDTLTFLIEQAGGLLADADPNSYIPNLVIGDYTEFYIAPQSKTPDTCIVENIKKYNINTATVDQLKSIGLNATQAQNVVDYRSEHGSFKTLEEILLVNGIGDKTYQNIRDYITLK